MTSVNLESPSVPSGYRDFIAVGTGFDFAEDRACRGNVRVIHPESSSADAGDTSYIYLK
jgi:cleavage and polyadenylation specificity factor subunit 1